MDETNENTTEPTTNGEGPRRKGIRGYWVGLLRTHPSWLNERSNDKLYKQYLKDHPDETDVPANAKQGLSTAKSQLRKEYEDRKHKRKHPGEENGTTEPETTPTVAVKGRGSKNALENLEARIDDVLDIAKGLGTEGLERVLSNLKSARNAVIVLLHEG